MERICELICGTALFLFGISLMGEGLQQAGGSRMERWLRRMTDGRMRAFWLGAGVTALVQSSSAVTVLAAELADSGLLSLQRVIPVLIGANVGTTATAWLLCTLHAAEAELVKGLPSLLLALVGTAFYLMPRRRHWGSVLLGLLLFLTGMEMITAAAEPLGQSAFVQSWIHWCQQPVLGLVTGMVLTALVQSSSVSVGLLQALSVSGGLTYAVAVPVILGQNIGTCVTVIFAALGGKHPATQTAWAHFLFNVIGAAAVMLLLLAAPWLGLSPLLARPIDMWGISVVHTVFNLVSAAVFLPLTDRFAALIERISPKERQSSMLRSSQ